MNCTKAGKIIRSEFAKITTKFDKVSSLQIQLSHKHRIRQKECVSLEYTFPAVHGSKKTGVYFYTEKGEDPPWLCLLLKTIPSFEQM